MPADVGWSKGTHRDPASGDRTELRSLAASYTAPAGRARAAVGIGQVKHRACSGGGGRAGPCEGHSAAQHAAIPPRDTASSTVSSREMIGRTGLRLADKLTPWRAVDGWRTAAVSAFESGTHSHLMPDTVSAPERGPECGR